MSMRTQEDAHRLLFVLLVLATLCVSVFLLIGLIVCLHCCFGLHACLATALACLAIFYKRVRAVCVPVVTASEALRRHTDLCPSLNCPYRPPWWANGLMNSTAFAICARRNIARLYPPEMKTYVGRKEFFALRDGGQVALDWCCPPDASDDSPIVVFLHGVVGHGRSSYFSRSVEYHETRKTGWRLLSRSWRGIDAPLLSPKTEDWCHQAAEDTVAVLREIKKRYPSAPIFMQGMSVGAACILNCLPEAKDIVRSALAVSGPGSWVSAMTALAKKDHMVSYAAWNLRVVCKYLSETHGQKSGFEVIEEHQKVAPGTLQSLVTGSTSDLIPGRTFFNGVNLFHDKITTKGTGHASHKEYYEDCDRKILRDIENLETPTLCMFAEDDPVTGIVGSFVHRASSNPMIASYITKFGGHCGWFTSIGNSLVDEVAFEWFSSFK